MKGAEYEYERLTNSVSILGIVSSGSQNLLLHRITVSVLVFTIYSYQISYHHLADSNFVVWLLFRNVY